MVWMNSMAASSAKDGEFETSGTTAAPSSASARTWPVRVFTPVLGGGGHRLVAVFAQFGGEFGSGESGSTYHNYFHRLSIRGLTRLGCRAELAARKRRQDSPRIRDTDRGIGGLMADMSTQYAAPTSRCHVPERREVVVG